MALSKKIVKVNGIETNYHKINTLSIKAKEDGVYHASVGVSSYVSKEIRDISKDYAVDGGYYFFNIDAITFETTPIFEVVYAQLKTLPEFEGAEDA